MTPRVKQILDSLTPVLEDQPTEADLKAMDELWDAFGLPLKGILRAKVINAE